MRKIQDFDTEKKIFIGKVLNHIHYNKLHARIYEELSNHMDDMHEDFSNTCDDEREITKRILDEMGNPDELGNELQKIHKSVLLRARIRRTIISTIVTLLCPFIVFSVCESASDFINSSSIKNIEKELNEYQTDGVELLTEFEYEGVEHKIYTPVIQDENFRVYHASSIKLFGLNVKNRFKINYQTYFSTESYALMDLEPDTVALTDAIFIFFDNPQEKYIKIRYIPTEDNIEEYYSDYIELCQSGTIETPECVVFDCPDGYRWNNYERYDENKELIEWE